MTAKTLHRFAGLILLAAPALAAAAQAAAESAGAAVHEAAEPDGGAALLSYDQGTAFWTLVLFVLLLVVLGKLVWPKITAGLDAREGKIRSDILGAESANAQAQQVLAQYQQKLADAAAEARKAIDQARADAEALRAKLVHETEAEIQKLKARATSEINQARNQAVQDLYAKASELSLAVAEKILQRQITETDTTRLIDQSLAELDRLKVG
jgi:F-type H+-transporting ATPase subunit b